jgi:hypothetical protein
MAWRAASRGVVLLLIASLGARCSAQQRVATINISTAQELQRVVNNRSTADLSAPVYVTIQQHLDLRPLESSQNNNIAGELLDPVKRNLVIRVRCHPDRLGDGEARSTLCSSAQPDAASCTTLPALCTAGK